MSQSSLGEEQNAHTHTDTRTHAQQTTPHMLLMWGMTSIRATVVVAKPSTPCAGHF